jgi:cellulose biosynthesis protein BcsQ
MNPTPTPQAPQDSQRPIYWIGGSKGGVGKSLMTAATLDCLLERGTRVRLVESDTSNPDVWKAYKDILPVELINLDPGDGWVDLALRFAAGSALSPTHYSLT